MDFNYPIGIFDSGIGGLTVANAILKQLPNEHIVYFGDTAHLPYGDKSADAIKSYAKKIGNFLVDKHAKIIVIACNTASSVAYDLLTKSTPEHVQIINVIDPVVHYIIQKKYKKVGVIGTQGTIKSNIYQQKIHLQDSSIKVHQLATPLLAPMIESGFVHGQISDLVIEEYLQHANLQDIDTLILGCTHYPLIKKEIEHYYNKHNKNVEVLATNEIVGKYVKQFMIENGLLNVADTAAKHSFYVSDYSDTFAKTTNLFFGKKIELKAIKL
ncbi:MAG: glutamate racemase [Sphingobacteriales bacterium]|jgi:glutamate racemase|nr:MAG: glutamate racemase [Sphingobacteriales bacterium]